ncbi:Zinc finger-domain containing protein [Parasponia andersonii]|uniref:Zinc finger-domain containing protein n=1 Tax=Parasponia andersonii TaxID=3476 RepID=A0A2P5CKY1_PARAD|nr:Zinc finger-domain containing protein [Parasponia andersonii]
MMMETNQPVGAFCGVWFVLVGFDPINEHKIRFKLVEGGGVDAGQYSRNCTHVIGDKIVYDHPLCVTAREDGKIVVNGLWVDHSFDSGTPNDHSMIMYRLPKDLNGIPGAKSLIMCLTGYQRQDRDDIMAMVRLMGAQFSKPLVANKVTHLICYKFEGEKYELAKRLPQIKLVNHRWLENCLRDWELLPEANYNKSDYELEMMEAEAKDSEDEAKDSEDEADETSVKQYVVDNVHKSPPSLKDRLPEERKSPNFVAVEQNILPDSTLPRDTLNVNTTEHTYHVDGVENRSVEASNSDNVPVSYALGYQDAGSLKQNPYSDLPYPLYRTPDGKNARNNLTSNSGSAERPPHSDGKFSAGSCTRKTPRRLGELLCSGSGFDKEPLVKLIVDDLSSSILMPAQVENKIGPDYVEAPKNGTDLPSGVCPTDFSPPKEISNGSYGSPSLQKTSKNVKSCIRKSPSPSSKVSGLQPMPSLDEYANVNSAIESRSTNLTIQFSSFTKSPPGERPLSRSMMSKSRPHDSANEKTSPSSSKKLKMSDLSGVPEFNDFVMGNSIPVTVDMGEPQNDRKGVNGSASNSDPEINKSSGSSSLNLVGDENLVPKPMRKKEVAKKTLGARPKKGSTANQKGSIYLGKEIRPQNDAAIGLSGEENEKSPLAKKSELSSAIVNEEAPTKAERNNANKSADYAVYEIESPDDETEAPEEKEELVSENVVKEENDIGMEKKSTDAQHLSNDDTANIQEMALEQVKEGNESENVVNNTLAEPSSKGDSLKRKKLEEKKCTIGKPKKKKVLDVRNETKSKELVDSEEIRNEDNEVKEIEEEKTAVTGSVPKSKRCNVSKNKLKNSVEEEKENKPINGGAEKKSRAKKHAEKSSVESVITPKNIKQSAAKCSPNSSRQVGRVTNGVRAEPVMFILSGHRFQRKEFQSVIRRLKGKFCRDSHQWSYQATHFIAPDPIRRTEKFFAAAASGRWILKTDYLTASNQAGKFMEEEPYEWYKNGLNEDGAINLEAPRKWRLLRERTGHGAFHGMRIIIYGECIAPPLDTLKRVVKAGDGTILATSPPYTRFLNSGADFAIVTPGMPRVDAWVQEFLKHEIPCVVADYLVEYVCKPGYSLDKHVLYSTHAWAEKSFGKLQERAEEVVVELTPPDSSGNDVACQVCRSRDRGEVMLICGNENGSTGCGIGCHVDCCDPPFDDIPEADWFCLDCIKSKTSEKA